MLHPSHNYYVTLCVTKSYTKNKTVISNLKNSCPMRYTKEIILVRFTYIHRDKYNYEKIKRMFNNNFKVNIRKIVLK